MPIRLVTDNRQLRIGLYLADLSSGMGLEAHERIDIAILDRVTDCIVPRGVGVIDIQKIFGMGAVQESTQIDLIIKFEEWTDGYVYDRLGLEDDYMQILDVSVPCVTIPVRAGRNLAGIAEIAAMNNRQKKMGYNAAVALAMEHDMAIDAGLF